MRMKEMKKEKGQSHNRPAIHPVKHTERWHTTLLLGLLSMGFWNFPLCLITWALDYILPRELNGLRHIAHHCGFFCFFLFLYIYIYVCIFQYTIWSWCLQLGNFSRCSWSSSRWDRNCHNPHVSQAHLLHLKKVCYELCHLNSSIGRELEQGFKLGRFFLCATQIVN